MRRRWNLMHRAVYTLLLIMKQFSSGRKNHGKLHPALEQLQNVALFHRFLTRELINELIFVIHLIDDWSTFTYKQDILYIIFHGKTLFQKHRFHSSKAIITTLSCFLFLFFRHSKNSGNEEHILYPLFLCPRSICDHIAIIPFFPFHCLLFSNQARLSRIAIFVSFFITNSFLNCFFYLVLLVISADWYFQRKYRNHQV